MKKIVLLLFLVYSAVFSYELSFNKKFQQNTYPDILHAYVKVSIESENERYINENLEKFNSFIKEDKTVTKKNGSFVLNPMYRYFKEQQQFMGYTGSLRYEIKSKDAKKMNEFLDKLIEIKKGFRTRDIKLSISNLTWKISDENHDMYIDKLRMKAILWADEYKDRLSSKLSKNCIIKHININDNPNVSYFKAAKTMEVSSTSNLAPLNSSQKIVINPNFKMECK
ncbi:MAG: SIMPL domain-containing protein [Campylobacterota bacterium]